MFVFVEESDVYSSIDRCMHFLSDFVSYYTKKKKKKIKKIHYIHTSLVRKRVENTEIWNSHINNFDFGIQHYHYLLA